VKDIAPEKFHFIDESGIHRAMTRERGRAPRGERLVGRVPRNRGTVTSVIGSLSLKGIDAVMTIEGATTGAVFTAFVEHVLLPRLSTGDVVVLDNVGAHKVKRARQLIEDRGARLLFLPPYHPEFNPIENAWSKVKALLRAAEARTIDALDQALAAAIAAVSASDAAGWFRHCGYQVN
jgi:transposase